MVDNWTGERLETFINSDVSIEHLHRYAVTLQFASSKTVLDIACGEGYGSNLLSAVAKNVIGVDISEDVIDAAKLKYKHCNLEFICGSTSAIPVQSDYFDVVVSFETIEHHDEHEQMMQEIKRVLKKDGILIISTPDKKFYTDKRNYKNPFHVKELYCEEFKSLLSSFFLNTQFYFQNNVVSSSIVPENNQSGRSRFFNGGFNCINEVPFNPLYILGIASDGALPETEISFFDAQYVYQNQVQEQIRLAADTRAMETSNVYEHSISFLAGRFITFPFRWLKKLLKKK